MPFKPGPDANRGVGRPRKTVDGKNLPELARALTEEALETMAELMRNAKDDKVKLAAAVAIHNRGWGSPKQTLDINNKHEHEVQIGFDVSAIPLEARRALMAAQLPDVQDAQWIEQEEDPLKALEDKNGS